MHLILFSHMLHLKSYNWWVTFFAFQVSIGNHFYSVFSYYIMWIAIPPDSILLKANTIHCELRVVLLVQCCSCCDSSTLFLGNNFHVTHLRPLCCSNEQLQNLSGFNADLFLIHITRPFLLMLFILGSGQRTGPF